VLNLVGAQTMPVRDVDAGYVRVFSLSATIGVACCIALIMFLLEAVSASSGWFWGCLCRVRIDVPAPDWRLDTEASPAGRRLLQAAATFSGTGMRKRRPR
jgi:hypothetical protein